MQSYEEIFHKRAHDYHQAMLHQPLARAQEFANLCSFVEARCASVLDIPAGGGYLRPWLPAGARLAAVDFSPAFAAIGRGAVTLGAPEAFGEFGACGPSGGPFDHVLSLTGLHHLPDVPGFLRECHRVLEPGGKLVIGEVRKGSRVAAFLNEFVDAHNPMGHRGAFLDAGFVHALEQCGFARAACTTRAYHWVFDDAAAMASFCSELFGLSLASPQTVLQGLGDYLGHERDNGYYRLRWELMFLTAFKA